LVGTAVLVLVGTAVLVSVGTAVSVSVGVFVFTAPPVGEGVTAAVRVRVGVVVRVGVALGTGAAWVIWKHWSWYNARFCTRLPFTSIISLSRLEGSGGLNCQCQHVLA